MYMSFSVVINSDNAFFSTSQRNMNQYLINWDGFPDHKYKMTFDFCSGVSVLLNSFSSTSRSFCIIAIDGLPSLNYTAGSVQDSQPTTQVGTAILQVQSEQTTLDRRGILFCSPSDNPPLYLPYKPSSNIITVRLFSTDGTQLHDRLNFVRYVLRLHFTPID